MGAVCCVSNDKPSIVEQLSAKKARKIECMVVSTKNTKEELYLKYKILDPTWNNVPFKRTKYDSLALKKNQSIMAHCKTKSPNALEKAHSTNVYT